MPRRTGLLLLGVLAAILLGAVIALRPLFVAPPPVRPPDVVLITVDTLRVDRLGAYGATGVATPNVDRLAAEGTLYENASCPMPMTRPSLSSLHSSTHPRENGVVNNSAVLPEEFVTLAGTLKAAGWSTGGFVGVRLLDADSGLARGFDVYESPARRPEWRASEVAPRAIGWLRAQPVDRPLFLWLHLFDPHLPYYAPDAPADPGDAGPARVRPEISWSTLETAAGANDGDVPAATLARALDLYAAEVEFADRWVGEVLRALAERGRLDETVVVFSADHGECFDHGVYFEHADCLYDGAVRIPLILRDPRAVGAGVRVEGQVTNLDVAPTILALAGIRPPAGFRGKPLPLAPIRDDELALIQYPLYQEKSARGRTQRQSVIRSVAGHPTRPVLTDRESAALRSESWKLIATGDELELYDLRTDPAESENLATTRPEVARELQAALQARLARQPLVLRSPGVINERLRETLEALGYVE